MGGQAHVLAVAGKTHVCLAVPIHPSASPLGRSEVDLSGNQLEDVGALAALPSLSKLNLAGNRLRSWAQGDGRFAALESLDCSFNHNLEPRVLQGLAELPRLRALDISGQPRGSMPR